MASRDVRADPASPEPRQSPTATGNGPVPAGKVTARSGESPVASGGVPCVALDATSLLGVRTGVGAFCFGALGALARRRDVEVSAFAVTWRRRGRLPAAVPAGVPVRQRAMPARPLHALWSRRSFPPVEWFVGGVDAVHGTNYVVPPTRRAARVVTVYDLTTVRFPELCDEATLAYPALVRRAVGEGAWVHVISRFVAEEVVAEFAVDPARVRVVYPGVSDDGGQAAGGARHAASGEMSPESSGVADDGGDRSAPGALALPEGITRYVLAVGTVEPRKDYPTLVRAFDRLAGEHRDLALLIVGAQGWGADELGGAIASSPHSRRIVRLGYLSEARRDRVVSGAAALAFPSLYEGFGLPPLEAMRAGVPVVATNAGAVPEIVDDAALLVAPRDADALAGALTRVLSDETLRATLVERGRRRWRRFTWEGCAAGLAELYLDAVAGGLT